MAKRIPILSSLVVIACLAIPASSQAAQTNTWSGTDATITSDGTTNANGFVDAGYCHCAAVPSQWPGGDSYIFFVQTPSNVPLADRDGSPVSENCDDGAGVQCKIITSLTMTGGEGSDTVLVRTSTGGPSVNLTATLGGGFDTAEVAGTGARSVNGGGGTDLLKPSWVQAGTSPGQPLQAWDIDLEAGTASSGASADIAPQNFENVDLRPTNSTPAGHAVKGTDDPNVIDTDDVDASDDVDGRGGIDTIRTYGGDDEITGGPGADTIDCGNGTDTVTDAGAGDVLTNCETETGLIVNDTGDGADFDLEDGGCDADDAEDGDQCTLRAAIQEANARDGEDEISFAIEPTGVATILPEKALPAIKEGVTIDGGTQPGAPLDEPGVFIDGSDMPSGKRANVGGSMMSVASGSNTMLERLGFVNGAATALAVQLDAQVTTIDGVLVGLRELYSSASLAPNALDGIRVEGLNTLIRDSVISGNGRYGVHFTGKSRLSKLVSSVVGTLGPLDGLPVGLGPLTNEKAAVAITDGAKEIVIGGESPAEGNEIGRSGVGVLLKEAGGKNDILSNQIGAPHADGAATELLANEGDGVRIQDTVVKQGQENEIALNTIANNDGEGILLDESEGAEITGNAIGALMSELDCTHQLIGNELRQIRIEGVKKLRGKAGPGPSKRFPIGLTGSISVGGHAASMLERLGGNLICDEDGQAIGMADVFIRMLVDSNVVEGGGMLENLRALFTENVITDSPGAGVLLKSKAEVELSKNRIFDNAGRPIELKKGPGLVEPDPLDLDNGPNGLQNYPFISFGVVSPTALSSRLSLIMAKSAEYRVEFFGSTSCDVDGQAEAEDYLGSKVLETSPAGLHAALVDLPDGAATALPFVAATATRLDVDDAMTSELSVCAPIVAEGEEALGIAPTKLTTKQGKVSAVVDCIDDQPCDAEAQVLDRDTEQDVGSQQVQVPAGGSQAVKIPLSAAARQLMEEEGIYYVKLRATAGPLESTATTAIYPP